MDETGSASHEFEGEEMSQPRGEGGTWTLVTGRNKRGFQRMGKREASPLVENNPVE
jgi:hypothetical protein